ncbi:MAG: UDP-3-O-(3-hydroxymyristoyl)glucosamine N-acyltransferase [Myxococcaceae bacterium]
MKARSLKDVAAHVGGELVGNPELEISGVNGLEEASSGQLSFYGNTRYRKQFEATKASAVLVGRDGTKRDGVSLIRVDNPHLAFAKVSQLFHPRPEYQPGISTRAFVHVEARVHPAATVMHGATVEAGAVVGARSVIFPGSYVGDHAVVGEDCLVYPNVTIREGCRIGHRCILHAGSVIGADGFGFAFDLETPAHVKIPQAGIVRLEDDVELGACSCVDRATVGETVIGKGTKIDNLVQIAHNVTVGPLTIICAQAGVSGSTEIGTGVVLAGQVGVVGHIRVGDMVKVGAQSGVAHDVEDGQVVSGSPAMPHKDWLRMSAAADKLPELLKELRALRKRVDELEKERDS